MQRSSKLFVVLLFFSSSIAAQDSTKVKSVERLPHVGLKTIRFSLIPPVSIKNSPGFFCRQEIKLEKITGIPIRFRLGSLEYTNWLEKKSNLYLFGNALH